MNKKMIAVLSFAGGIVIGSNWPKIKKGLKPLWDSVKHKSGIAYNTAATFLAEKKEVIKNMFATSKVGKKKKKPRAKKFRKEDVAVNSLKYPAQT